MERIAALPPYSFAQWTEILLELEQMDPAWGELLRRAAVRADRVSEEILADANRKAAEKLQKADADIAQEKKKAVNEIKDEISGMSVDIAEAMVRREIKEEDHKALIDSFIDSL